MEADWSVEIGAEAPTVDVPWENWVDLRHAVDPHAAILALEEVAAWPELAPVLLSLASSTAAVTSKCDVFPVDPLDADPFITELGEEAVQCGLGSYLDFVLVHAAAFPDLASCESLARHITRARLSTLALPASSVEIVIREGSFFGTPTFGLTVYAMGYGEDRESARATWAEAMRQSASITMVEITARVTEHRGIPAE